MKSISLMYKCPFVLVITSFTASKSISVQATPVSFYKYSFKSIAQTQHFQIDNFQVMNRDSLELEPSFLNAEIVEGGNRLLKHEYNYQPEN